MLFGNRWSVLGTALLVALVSADLAAQAKAQEQRGARQPKDNARSDAASVTVVFRDGDRAAFKNYFTAHAMTAQPLPPGIAKNLARGKPLPPGIAKRALPPGLLLLAPPQAEGVSYAIIGDVVVATRAGVVIDILFGVFK